MNEQIDLAISLIGDIPKPKYYVDMILATTNVIVSGNDMVRVEHKGKFYLLISRAMFDNVEKISRGYKNDPIKNPVFLGIPIEINEDLVDEILSNVFSGKEG